MRWCSTPRPGRTRCRSSSTRTRSTRRRKLAAAVNDLLLPIVKGYGSERSWVLLGTESLQTFGGSGLPAGVPDRAVRPRRQDRHPLRGHHGDPGPGLLLPQDRQGPGRGARPPRRADPGVRRERGRQRPAQGRARRCSPPPSRTPTPWSAHMINDLMSADPTSETGDLRNIYKVGLNTSRLLMVLGDVVCAWLLLRQAEIALEKLGGGLRQGQVLLRGQDRRGPVLRAHQPAEDQRRGRDRAGHRPVGDGPVRGRVLSAS